MDELKFKKGEYVRINPDLLLGKRYYMHNKGKKQCRKYATLSGRHLPYKGCLATVRCVMNGKYRLNIYYDLTHIYKNSIDWTDDMLQKVNEE